MKNPTSSAIPLEPSTIIRDPEGTGALAIVGHRERDGGSIALYQVFVNCDVGKGARKALVALPLHEVPLHRMKHRESGGDLEIIVSWVPNVPQVRPMTRVQLEDELARLRGRVQGPGSPPIGGAYLIQRGEHEINLFSQIYGGENGVKVSLFRKMKELYEGWLALLKSAEDQMRRLLPDEVEDLIKRVCMPEDELDEIEEVPLLSEEVAEGLKGIGNVEINSELRDWLITQKSLPDRIVDAFVREVAIALTGKPEDAVVSDLGDEAWERVPTVKKHIGKRNHLLKCLAEYDALPAVK